jgi:hypothetical protein
MAIIRIDFQVVVDANGDIGPTPIITVPNQAHPIRLVWTIVGGVFDPANGIVINSGPTSVISSLHGDELEWSAVDTNNGQSSSGEITYTINYTADLSLQQQRRDDPVIDNQPPTG